MGLGQWLDRRRAAAELAAREADLTRLIERLAVRGATTGDRVAAAAALGQVGTKRAIDALIGQLADGLDYDVGKAIVGVLAQCGAAAVSQLTAALDSPDRGVRARSAETLGAIGGAEAINALIGALGRDAPHTWPHSAVAFALGRSGDAAMPQIIAALASSNPTVRHGAAEALGAARYHPAVPDLVRTLGDSDATVRYAVADALAAIGTPDVVEPLAGILDDPRRDTLLVEKATRALAALGAGSDRLVAALERKSVPLDARAIEALGKMKDTRAVGLLRAVLTDARGDWQERTAAAGALGAIGDPAAIPSLIAVLDAHPGNISSAATAALGAFGDGATAAALLTVSEPTALGTDGRRVASGVFARTRRADALPLLILWAADPNVGQPAAEAILAILTRPIGAPTVEALRALAGLPDTVQRDVDHHVVIEGGYDSAGYSVREVPVSCAKIRMLAQAALATRERS